MSAGMLSVIFVWLVAAIGVVIMKKLQPETWILYLVWVVVVCILLTLLHLGIKNIRLGPSLPAFVSPNILNFLTENFGIAPITTPAEDLEALLK